MRWGWNQWCFLLSRPQPLTLASLGLGSKQYSAAIAFTLALFSHLVNHVNIRLQAELEEGENPVPAFQSDGAGAGMGEAVGFHSNEHFIRTFTKLTGVSPKQYARQFAGVDKQ